MSVAANFCIGRSATLPFLELRLTKSGIVQQFPQQGEFSCDNDTDSDDFIDLSDGILNVCFEFFTCGRTPNPKQALGKVVILQDKDASGKITNKGLVRYEWHPADTAEEGFLFGVFTVNFFEGQKLLWPYQREQLIIRVG